MICTAASRPREAARTLEPCGAPCWTGSWSNQALRLAVDDLEHVTTLLGYLASVGEARGDANLSEFCRSWERRLRRQEGAVRRAAIELGSDPDGAVEPLDDSPAGRAAHGVAWT